MQGHSPAKLRHRRGEHVADVAFGHAGADPRERPQQGFVRDPRRPAQGVELLRRLDQAQSLEERLAIRKPQREMPGDFEKRTGPRLRANGDPRVLRQQPGKDAPDSLAHLVPVEPGVEGKVRPSGVELVPVEQVADVEARAVRKGEQPLEALALHRREAGKEFERLPRAYQHGVEASRLQALRQPAQTVFVHGAKSTTPPPPAKAVSRA